MSPHTNGLPKTVGDGSRVKFWQDRWCGETSLATSYPELSVDPYHTKLHPWPITNIIQNIGRPSRSFEIFVLDCWPLYTPCLLGCPSLISIKLITYKKNKIKNCLCKRVEVLQYMIRSYPSLELWIKFL